MLKKILYAIVIALILFVGVGQFLPKTAHVERSITIDRPAATVFTVLNTYRSFSAWSPWADRDPGARYEISGPESGPGAKLTWSGDPRMVGAGWQEIVESQPYRMVRMSLDFDQQGTAASYFQLAPAGDGTHVTWGFDTNLVEDQGWLGALLARYFGLFFDTWVGTDYELGLGRLKSFVENLPQADFSQLDVQIVDAEGADVLYVESDASLDSPDLTASLAAAYREITAFMAANGIDRAAQPMAITRIRTSGAYDVEAAIPVVLPDSGQLGATGRVRKGRSPSGRAVRVVHRGPYEHMGPTYEKLAAWMAAHGVAEGDVSWEQYISDPGETPESELVTHIYFRIADGD